MPDQSPILQLPYILPAQAQKHVTHNEALRLLDIIVQLAVISRTLTTPPVSPAVGDRYLVAAPATGAWAGQATKIAVFMQTGWEFVAPRAGWQAFVQASTEMVVFDGVAWVASGVPTVFDKLGVNTTANNTNRLSVASAATLLTHEGAGHQLKLNKAAAGDTASLLFQTGFSGRAEMGLAGNDDFSVKVSANGSAFSTGFTVARTDGLMTVPNGMNVASGLTLTGGGSLGGAVALTGVVTSTGGMTVDGTLQGTAVQANAMDVTANRLLRVGAFGLGAAGVVVNTDWNLLDVTGLFRSNIATTPNTPTAFSGWHVIHIQGETNTATQLAMRTATDEVRFRRRTAGVWAAWVVMYTAANLVGTVSQAGGLPTGGVIERGTGANGDFTRFADGTLICVRNNLSVTNASTASGALFKSSVAVTWTFPSVFIAAPVVTANCQVAGCWATNAGVPTTTSVALEAMSGVTQAAALTLRAMAVGRWF